MLKVQLVLGLERPHRADACALAELRVSNRWRPTADGRLPKVTNGCFVEAKQEKPALSIEQLWSDRLGGWGREEALDLPSDSSHRVLPTPAPRDRPATRYSLRPEQGAGITGDSCALRSIRAEHSGAPH